MGALRYLKGFGQVYYGRSVAVYATVLSIMKIDEAWFQAQIKSSSYGSQRQIAMAMGIDRSALNKILKGTREMSAWEQFQLSKMLNQPLDEIAKRAGFDRRWRTRKRRPI
jgi:transcriptional regulator with XRE-family HTH domain